MYIHFELNVDIARNIFTMLRPFRYSYKFLYSIWNIKTVTQLVWVPCGDMALSRAKTISRVRLFACPSKNQSIHQDLYLNTMQVKAK